MIFLTHDYYAEKDHEFLFDSFHQNLENSIHNKFTTALLLHVLQFHVQNSSFSVLPLIDLNELTNRDVSLRKDMIGGNADNGKGDTYF